MAVYDEVNNFKKLFKEPRIIGCQNSGFYLHWEKPICNLATVLRNMKKFFQESNWNYYSSAIQRVRHVLCFLSCLVKALVTLALLRLFTFSQKLSRYLHTVFKSRNCGKTSLNSNAVTIGQTVEKIQETC